MPRGGHSRSGPVALDAATRALRGSRTRAHHHGRDAAISAAQPGQPGKPGDLGAAGAREWDRLVQLLEDEDRLTLSDGPALETAARSYEIAAVIRRRKLRAKGADFLKFSAAERNALAEHRKALSDLCLNAATRARAPRVQEATPDELAAAQRQRFFSMTGGKRG